MFRIKYFPWKIFCSTIGAIKVPLKVNASERLKHVDEDYNNFHDEGLNKMFRFLKNFYGLAPRFMMKSAIEASHLFQTGIASLVGSSETYFLNGIPIQSVHPLSPLFYSNASKSKYKYTGFTNN